MYEHFCEAADSVLAQTYDDIELVVIVDGTTEVYESVTDDYSDYEEVVTECNSENIGLLESRNRGAELASGDVVAFIDDDAVADREWIERLVSAYYEENAIAAGGKMTPDWVAGKPSFLPEEFFWLVGVTHRGFTDSPGEVRNTFGSNISFRINAFEELNGFNADIGGREGEANLQGGETEICARLSSKYGRGVQYDPNAKVAHKVFKYRIAPRWLIDRAFWQGYSKRGMETLLPESAGEEYNFIRQLLTDFVPTRLRNILSDPSYQKLIQFMMLFVFTGFVAIGYLYGIVTWR